MNFCKQSLSVSIPGSCGTCFPMNPFHEDDIGPIWNPRQVQGEMSSGDDSGWGHQHGSVCK